MVAQPSACTVVQRRATVGPVIEFATFATTQTAVLQSAGQVFVIRCEPDPFTGERINVGVCVIAPNGQRLVKVISDPGRLDCLYGEDGAGITVSMAQVAGACASKGLPPPSSQIHFDEPVSFFNANPEDMLESTFADQVTVALPRRAEKAKKQLDDLAALSTVTNYLKRLKGLNVDFLANTPQVLVNTERGQRAVNVPIQPKNGVATIRSADYTAATLKTHLMDSLLDLECAARYRQKKHLGIFILRPEHASDAAVKAVDHVIDSVAFRAPGNLRMEVEYDGETLAKAIDEWVAETS